MQVRKDANVGCKERTETRDFIYVGPKRIW
jgi:hypothetical protein